MNPKISLGNHHSELSKESQKQVSGTVETMKRSITSSKELRQAESRGEEFTISEKQLIQAIEKAIQSMQGERTHLQFSVHEETKQIMVKVINSESNEIIREIPPEKSLDFLAKIWERAGLIVDEKR